MTKTKVIGVGLNKTATKTLKQLLVANNYRHQSYDLEAFKLFQAGKIGQLLDWMEDFDSFEDWPWPLFYKAIDERFPNAKFVLTVRSSPEAWYRSLCKMAIRMGPLNDFEKHIYGYAMPQGKQEHHIQFYNQHNLAVQEHFANRAEKLLTVCFGNENDERNLADFLGLELNSQSIAKTNESLPVYSGDNLFLAHLSRIQFQSKWKLLNGWKAVKKRIYRAINPD